jgi:hypothetical protein|tara:strand:- start:182 stop:1075 length:894 start_codon:yes stop_codon:yes gene_type:complete
MADQVFSTIQIPVNQWRWLPVTCLDSAGDAVTTVVANQVEISFIRSGELSVTLYATPDFDSTASNLVGSYTAGVTTIKLQDTSSFPPENGKIVINPGVVGSVETREYSYNNVSTGELLLTTPTVNLHGAGETVERVDWVEVNATVAPGNYLLLLPPNILSKEDIFTYIVTNGSPPPVHPAVALFEPYFNTIDIVGSLDPVTFTPPSLATCKLYGFVVGLAGKAVANTGVSVKLLSVPSTMSNAGIYDVIVSTKTDTNGYFEINVLQQATVDVVIADIGYRRTVTVPSTTLAKLFELS